MEILKPNMYVRTKNHNGFAGGVGKIEKIQDDKTHKTKWITLDRSLDGISFLVNISEITKASHNIIDLIEADDYVNGHKVCDDFRLDTDDYGNNFIEIGIESDKFLNHYIREDEIETIVTKQQFESMQYEVK